MLNIKKSSQIIYLFNLFVYLFQQRVQFKSSQTYRPIIAEVEYGAEKDTLESMDGEK